MYDVIRSKDNPKVKWLTNLHDRRKASKEGLVFVEGVRVCEDALISGSIPSMVCVTEKQTAFLDKWSDVITANKAQTLVVTDECFAKIASTVNPQGVVIVVKEPTLTMDNIPFRGDGNDIYVVLESVQDPGNIGTIIRMADAFDFSAVIMTNGCVDPFNEKAIRASMGSCWHLPLVKVGDSEQAMEFFKAKGITSMAMELNGEVLSSDSVSTPAAYFIGNEGNGLKAETIAKCDLKVKIPMPGKAESLNAASAASIMGYALHCARK